MSRGAVTRLLVLIVWSLLFPPNVWAGDDGNTIRAGSVGDSIRMFVRISDKETEGRMSAVPYVVVSRPAGSTPGKEETRNPEHGGTFEALSNVEKAGTTGNAVATALLEDRKVGGRIGAMVSGMEEISYTKVSGILRNVRDAVKKNRRKPPAEESVATVKETTVPGPFSMAR
ncbi:MAG: hypothetical protein M0Z38_03980 [Deltaproteobacteria bacterium]|nr:hypothetical protein [Deltaproteobacteria bacterium]